MPPVDPLLVNRLDKQYMALREKVGMDNMPGIYEQTVEEARNRPNVPNLPAREENMTVRDSTVTARDGYEVPIRVYTPDNGGSTPWPCFLNLHGGGFVFGNLDSQQELNSIWADQAQCVVVVVDYRLGPEYTFPTAHYDVEDVYKYILANLESLNVDGANIAVGGYSAGGNLCASLCHVAAEEGFAMPKFQLLLAPVLDARTTVNGKRYEEQLIEAPGLTAKGCDWLYEKYAPDLKQQEDPRLSPMFRSNESFAKLPPAIFIVAEVDLLTPDSAKYCEKLRENGVPVLAYEEFAGQVHIFMALCAYVDEAARACHRIGQLLKEQFY